MKKIELGWWLFHNLFLYSREASLAFCPLGQYSLTPEETMALVMLMMEQSRVRLCPRETHGYAFSGVYLC